MRILHVIATLDPAAGGPIEGVRTLFSYKAEGYEGEAVTLDAPDAPYLQGLPFPVHALGPRTSTYGYNAKLLPWLKANRERYNGVIVNGLWQYMGLAAMLAMKGHVPYMVFSHGMLDPYFKTRYPLKHLKKAVYWYPAEYWVLRRAYRTLFTTVTEEKLAEQSFAFWQWKAQVVPYGIRAPGGDPDEDVAAFFRVVPEVAGKRFLIYLSRIHPKKGCDLLLQAFAEVAASDPSLHLVMAGPDETGWMPKLRAIVEQAGVAERVHWPGILRGAEKWGAFRAAEAFLLPSHQENFGIAVAEALAAAKPVLLSDKVNIGDMIRDEGCALIEPDTLDGTRALLRRWIALSPDTKRSMSEAAAECFRMRFDMLETAHTIMNLFAQAKERRSTLRMPRQAAYVATHHIDAAENADPYLRPAFSRANQIKRLVWGMVWLLLYRTSPRPLHAWRAMLLRLFGATMGPNCHFYPASKVWAPWNLVCADQVTAADGAEIYNPAPMHFGSHAIVSQGAYLCGATHDYNSAAFPLIAFEMHFGARSWVCARASVAPGVSLGEGAVLGMASVATRSLEPWTVYAGNPAVALKAREKTA